MIASFFRMSKIHATIQILVKREFFRMYKLQDNLLYFGGTDMRNVQYFKMILMYVFKEGELPTNYYKL